MTFRRYTFLILLLSQGSLAAQAEDLSCPAPFPPPVAPQVLKLSELIGNFIDPFRKSFFAARPELVRRAYCLRKKPFSEPEILAALKRHEGNSSAEVHGVKFKDESPTLIELFRRLTTPKREEWDFLDPTPLPAPQFTSTCDKVLCAAKEIFGTKEGPQLLFMLDRFGMNGSQIARPSNTSAWTSAELDDVLLGLSDIPEGVLERLKELPLTHAARDSKSRDMADASIMVYPAWDRQAHEYRRVAIVHEIGHNLARSLQSDESPEWRALGGWTRSLQIINKWPWWIPLSTKPDTLVSGYAAKNAVEDMAESIESYRYNPRALQKASPSKYAYIRDVIFDGMEFTSEEACTARPSLSAQLQAEARPLVPNIEVRSPLTLRRTQTDCARELLEQRTSAADLRPCLTEAAGKTAIIQAFGRRTWEFPEMTLKAALRYPHQLPVSEAMISELRGATLDKFRARLLAVILKDDHQWTVFGYYDEEPNAEALCSRYTPYTHLNAQNLGINEEMGEGEEFFAHNHRDEIQKIAERVCLLVQSQKPELGPMSEEEIAQALKQVFPD